MFLFWSSDVEQFYVVLVHVLVLVVPVVVIIVVVVVIVVVVSLVVLLLFVLYRLCNLLFPVIVSGTVPTYFVT